MATKKRMIDAKKLVSKINKLEVFYFTGETDIAVHDCQMVELGAVFAEIDEAPTVDAVEVVHGRWARKQLGKYTGVDEVCCSICGCFVGVVASDDVFREAIEGMNYCPNCGAKMDGDGNG